mmetsp:Transcript_20546/g.33844  ORF Transcript_20546/g.33844 Transcript_20546/m.33844 type:complete len:215 (-) Transcript_20546:1437-2081(-)
MKAVTLCTVTTLLTTVTAGLLISIRLETATSSPNSSVDSTLCGSRTRHSKIHCCRIWLRLFKKSSSTIRLHSLNSCNKNIPKNRGSKALKSVVSSIPTSSIHPLLILQRHLLRRSQRRVLRTRLQRAPPRSQLQRPLEAHPLALQNLPQTVLQLLLALRLQLIHPHLLKARLLLLQLTRQPTLPQAIRLLLPQALPLPLLQATPQKLRLLHLLS